MKIRSLLISAALGLLPLTACSNSSPTGGSGGVPTTVQVFLTDVKTSAGLPLCGEADRARLIIEQNGTQRDTVVSLLGSPGCIAEFTVSLEQGGVRFLGEVSGNGRPLMVGSGDRVAEPGQFDVLLAMQEVDALEVRTSTVGFGGSGAYHFSVDGGELIPIGASDTRMVGGLRAGTRSVALDAGVCAVEGRTVEISADPSQVAQAMFEVDCSLPGSLLLHIRTHGDGGPDTYVLAVTQTDPTPTPHLVVGSPVPNGAELVRPLPAGHYRVDLDVEDCLLITPPSALEVFVSPGEVVERNLDVICEDQAETFLRVITSTSGPGVQPGSYQVFIDDDAPRVMESNDAWIQPVEPGQHTVRLSGLAGFGGCALNGENPAVRWIESGTVETVEFTVVCVDGGGEPTDPVDPPPQGDGVIRIVTQTWGTAQPPPTYVATLTAAGMPTAISVFVGVNDSVEVRDLGSQLNPYTVHLDVTQSCEVRGNESVAANVPSGGVARVLFDVDCPGGGG